MRLEQIFDKVGGAWSSNHPFVLYSPPGESLITALVQKNNRLDFVTDFSESGFVMAPFDPSRKAVLFASENIDRYTGAINQNKDQAADSQTAGVNRRILNTADMERHLDLVGKGIAGIEKGDFVKVVLSRSETVAVDRIGIRAVFLSLLSKYPGAFVYLWYHPDIGLWAGASPETLLKTSGDQFRTMSLAGTQRFKGKMDVSWGGKEVREQQIVTEHIREALEGCSFKVGETYTKKAGNLLHLCSEIEGVMGDSMNLGNLIDRLHPTAAVCGLPKEKALQFILDEEGYDRGFYTGFLGELNRPSERTGDSIGGNAAVEESDLYVNLRCMQLFTTPAPKSVLYVGGGITSESDPMSEWLETVAKSLVVKSVLST